MNKDAVKKRYIKNPAIIQELRELVSKRGILSPKDIVDKARDPESALHNSFEWDDSVAAELYRLEQARGILQIAVEIIPNTSTPSRVFVSLTSDRESSGGYRPMVAVLSDKKLRERLLDDALDELRRFEQRYRELKELCGVFDAVKKVRAKR